MNMNVCKDIVLLVAVMLSLTQCAVQEVELTMPTGPSFEVYAIPSDTRTSNDGLSTLWNQGDRFSLFHAVSGTRSYVADGAFTVDNPSTGHAKGSVQPLAEGSYDWYMVYPDAAEATAPTAVSVTVGAVVGSAQIQAGSSSTDHLAGEGFPLGGKAASVSSIDIPKLAFSPILSVIAVNVTNPGPAAVTISEIKFKASEEIVGSFTVDVTDDAPVFTAANASDEAVLSVNGSVLEKGESAVFYLGIKPFTAASGASLTLTVNDHERTVVLSKSSTFAPGKIKKLNFTLDESGPPTPYYYKRVTSLTPGHKYIIVAEDTKDNNILRMALPLPEGTTYGFLDVQEVTDRDGIITLYGAESAFSFISSDNGLTIRQSDGRYLYNNNADNVYAGTTANSGFYWTVSFDEDGVATLLNRTRLLQYNPTANVWKFQTRQSSLFAGLNPRLYELQNDDELIDEFLQKTIPGVYDFNGESWLYADGTHQTAVRTLSSTVTFGLYQPAEYLAVQVSGIPCTVSTGDRFDLSVSRFVKQVLTHSGTFTATAVKVEDGTAWLIADGGTGFIVKIQ